MRSNIMSIAMFMAVMLAMTGLAAANPDQMNIFQGGVKVTAISLPVGGTANLDLNVSEFLQPQYTIHNMSVELYQTDGITHATGLDVTLEETVAPLGPLPGPATCTFSPNNPCDPLIRWDQNQGPGGSEVLSLKISDAAGVPHNYIVRIFDKATGQTLELSAATLGVSVPEFPTLAIPVAAVIGLVFLFQHKKRKEE